MATEDIQRPELIKSISVPRLPGMDFDSPDTVNICQAINKTNKEKEYSFVQIIVSQ